MARDNELDFAWPRWQLGKFKHAQHRHLRLSSHIVPQHDLQPSVTSQEGTIAWDKKTYYSGMRKINEPLKLKFCTCTSDQLYIA